MRAEPSGSALLLLLAGVLAAWPSPAGRAVARVRDLLAHPGAVVAPRPIRPARRAAGRRLLAAAGGLAVGALLGGGPAGLAAAALVTVAADRWLRAGAGEARDVRRRSRALEDDLPAACDLLGVCLDAGVPVPAAVSAVGSALSGPLASELGAVAALLRLGAEPRAAWTAAPRELAALGRVLVRAGESGSTVTPALRSLAEEGRSAARARTETAVRRAGVWVLAPLGLCFLPAFVCLGVVPLVLGIAGNVFR